MTTIEHRELKGITLKNVVVTLISTASIVASVMTTYFGLKTDIAEIKSDQLTETKMNNIRLRILEDQMLVLQKQMAILKSWGFEKQPANQSAPTASQISDAVLLSSINKKK